MGWFLLDEREEVPAVVDRVVDGGRSRGATELGGDGQGEQAGLVHHGPAGTRQVSGPIVLFGGDSQGRDPSTR